METQAKWRWLALLCAPFGIIGLIPMIIGACKGKTDGVSWGIFGGVFGLLFVIGLALG